ncbi:Pyocin activator protein PrtN [Vibrio crassostreae]|uniref:pyocin activator PrtN family protein n=1 Tax=Vibrio crassostreae TaxID=246167 RepID=UPI001B307531|nr:pyocin activator PrtN family protein [Vibrio crassostreae]CAK1942272.1 Pyocin activator protein PrtN [Vibrio crassostreae]CAK1948450.1 Pyocin activator protein PrtN [Vibrio crassostreae]CAK2014641.1 Pyocin activator protein PrtN [Vibrio crassostreae]CAK2329147.1 Pyocin activator protein PrtN [Vibrio crassostreae]CAK2329650.1 Pyocin activator protein PrtN [Vibrio crassostreae]
MAERNTRNLLSTKSMLAGVFGMKPCIPLAEVTEEFLDISFTTAQRKARLNELPFPAFRLGLSQKAPWYVNLDDLAEYIEIRSSEARKAWQRAMV